MENTSNIAEKQCFVWLEVTNYTTLVDVNDQFTMRHLGAIIFIGILMALGIFGNLTVLWIYIRRFKVSSYRIYVICLAVMDVTNCCIGMPFIVYYLSHYLLFPSSGLCKLGRFVMLFTNNSSAGILIVIACDRYRKVCNALRRQFSLNHAKFSCGLAVFVGIVTSWPTLVLFDIYTIDTSIPDVTGTRCWIADNYRNTVYPGIYYIALFIFNFFAIAILLVAYFRILLFLHRRKSSRLTINHTRKSTMTLLAVTIAFVLSALPHYGLVITTRILKDFNCRMTFSEGVAYHTFAFSILLNNSVNPFIYGFFDQKFRREMKKIYHDILTRRYRRPEDRNSSESESGSQVTTENRNTDGIKEKGSTVTHSTN